MFEKSNKETVEYIQSIAVFVGALFVSFLFCAFVVLLALRQAFSMPCQNVSSGFLIPGASSTIQLIGIDVIHPNTICTWSGSKWNRVEPATP